MRNFISTVRGVFSSAVDWKSYFLVGMRSHPQRWDRGYFHLPCFCRATFVWPLRGLSPESVDADDKHQHQSLFQRPRFVRLSLVRITSSPLGTYITTIRQQAVPLWVSHSSVLVYQFNSIQFYNSAIGCFIKYSAARTIRLGGLTIWYALTCRCGCTVRAFELSTIFLLEDNKKTCTQQSMVE